MAKGIQDWAITIVGGICCGLTGWAANSFLEVDEQHWIGLRKRIDCRQTYKENASLKRENEQLALENARLKKLRPFRSDGNEVAE